MKSLAAALVAAQKDMPAVLADAVNPHFNSKFVSLDHLIAKTKPVLTKHGLAIVQMPSNLAGQPALATTIIHAESGESITDTLPLVLDGQNMQKLGGALTYARRYSWAAALGICDEADDDGNSASAPSMGASQASTAPAPVGGASSGTGDGVGGRAAASSPAKGSAAAPQFTAPAEVAKNSRTGEGGDWTWPFGKHKGTRLEDTPLEYVMWYGEQGTKEDVKQKCNVFLAVPGGGFEPDDEGIPFRSTIDGLGN